MKLCPNCGNTLTNEMIDVNMCWQCGYILDPLLAEADTSVTFPSDSDDDYDMEDPYSNKVTMLKHSEKERKSHLLTTGQNLEGYHITAYLDVIIADIAIDAGIRQDSEDSEFETYDRRSRCIKDVITEAKLYVKEDLIEQSLSLGGNAVIGMHYSVNHLMGNMIEISAEGTSVIVRKE